VERTHLHASLGARVIINQGRVRRRRKNTYYTYVDTKLNDIIYITINRVNASLP
jgi:hypothetical protein